MTHPLTYFSLTCAASFISYFSGSVGLGTLVSYGFWLIYLYIFQVGGIIGSGVEAMTMLRASTSYFAAILVWSVVGMMGNMALRQFRFLSGEESRNSRESQNPVSSGVMAGFWIWFVLWQLGTLIIIEIDAAHFDFAVRGFLTVGLQAVGWWVYYIIARNETALFENQNSRSGAFSVAIWNFAVYLVYGVVYVSLQLGLSDADWFTNLWAFYTSLITAAFMFVFFVILYTCLVRRYDDVPMSSGTMKARASYRLA